VTRRGAAQVRPRAGESASDAWRAAVSHAPRTAPSEKWEPERWEEVDHLRTEATRAVARGDRPARRAVPSRADDADLGLETLEALSRAGASAPRLRERLRDAGRAYRRERYTDARLLLKPVAQSAPAAAEVRELLGLTYYRLGRWRDAIKELEAFRLLTNSTEQNPVLADSYRALRRYDEADALWEELREQSPSAELVAEGRIVAAGTLVDRGDLQAAIRLLERGSRNVRAPREHHLRTWYALADLYERAGDVPHARQLFARVAAADDSFADAPARVRALT
jgi:tetratricopeptide (TPR) repeat protein